MSALPPATPADDPAAAAPTVDHRFVALRAWLSTVAGAHAIDIASLVPASADASFRRYFRVTARGGSAIVMDAPPDRENTAAFVHVARLMAEAGLHVPLILAQDLAQGFLLLTDLGQRTYLSVLDPAQPQAAAPLMLDATDALIAWQRASRPDVLPAYDDALLRRELALFPDWYVNRHLGITLDDAQDKVLATAFDAIVASNLAEAQVFVHRDYMPRNLMVGEVGHAPAGNPGVLDFQDAVYGPISYDVASLFKDAFLSWDEEPILDWTVRYWERAKKAGLPVPADFGQFYRDVEWMGLQRHLKVLGIFARINYRDGKPHYLADSPRFVGYVRATANRYRALGPLLKLLDAIEGRVVEVGYTF
jgi:aminoglycoside/choline kinase family phosphotransferase